MEIDFAEEHQDFTKVTTTQFVCGCVRVQTCENLYAPGIGHVPGVSKSNWTRCEQCVFKRTIIDDQIKTLERQREQLDNSLVVSSSVSECAQMK
jgi:hypothetical protein